MPAKATWDEQGWAYRSPIVFDENASASDLVKRLRMVFREYEESAKTKVNMQTRYRDNNSRVLWKAGMGGDHCLEELGMLRDLPWDRVLSGAAHLAETDADPAERVATFYLNLAIEAHLRVQLNVVGKDELYLLDLIKIAHGSIPKLLTDGEAAACIVLSKGRNYAVHAVSVAPKQEIACSNSEGLVQDEQKHSVPLPEEETRLPTRGIASQLHMPEASWDTDILPRPALSQAQLVDEIRRSGWDRLS